MDQEPLLITPVDPTTEEWAATLAHLKRAEMTRHALQGSAPKPDTTYLALWAADTIVGHLSMRKQPLIVPPSHLTDDRPLPLTDIVGHTLHEMFVQTFFVEPDYRRQGHGRRLQQAALTETQAQGCYQMRSWSSADCAANYALKLSMGFAVSPALYPMPGGEPISGAYFTMVVVDG